MTSISLYVITKNAGAALCRCIQSAQPFVDEIVVVDTGSTDTTATIARALGAQVYHFASQPFSFAQARNFALERVTGDWVFYLDSDEEFCAQYGPRLRQLATAGERPAYAFLIQNYYPNGRWSSSPITRLYRRDPRLRYEKEIHETINYALQRLGFSPPIESVYIHHYGYLQSAQTLKQKANYYRALLEKQLVATPQDTPSWRYLALSMACLGQIDDAIVAVQKSIDILPDDKMSYVFLARFLSAAQRRREALAALETSLTFDAHNAWNPAIYNLMGLLHLRLDDETAAASCFARSAQETDEAHVWINLGLVHERARRWADALDCYVRAARLNPALLRLECAPAWHPYTFLEDVAEAYCGLAQHLDRCSQNLAQ